MLKLVTCAMSVSKTTFTAGGPPKKAVLPSSSPMKHPTGPAKSPLQSVAKSRIKNTPRREKLAVSTLSLTGSAREAGLYTQAGRSTTATSVPAIFNPQACSVLLVSETCPASVSSSVSSILASGAQTTDLVANAQSSTISNPKASVEVKPEGLFQNKPKSNSLHQKPRNEVHKKKKPVCPKIQTPTSVIIDLCDTPSPTADSNFVIPSNHTLTFHTEPAETPTSLGYTINITDILPPKPNQQKSPIGQQKLRVNYISNSQDVRPLPTLTSSLQLLPKNSSCVKSPPKIIAPQPMKIATPVNSQASYLHFQPDPDDTPSDGPTVIPITIIGSAQESFALDATNAHFISQALPHLVPFQTPSQGTPPKLDKFPDGMENSAVQVIDVADNHQGTNIGEIHHGLTKSVPEPYAADILSQLPSEGSLPAISCSQVSSVLSALDSPDTLFQTESPPKDKKKPPKSKKAPRKTEGHTKSRRKQKSNKKEEEAKAKRDRIAEKLVERVECYKCRFCLFLTLDQAAVTKHIQQEHSSHVLKAEKDANVIPCPGCSNVFLSEKSLSVHLSEDHKVALEELNEMITAMVAPDSSGQVAKKGKLPRQKRTSAKIRVRNLMKDAPAPAPAPPPPSDTIVTQEELVCETSPTQQMDYDCDDHDYATIAHDSDDEDGNENSKKRRRRKRKGVSSRKKRKVNAESENFLETGYKCSVSFCAVRMMSHDNLVYHQRCHKNEKQTGASTPGASTPNDTAQAEGKRSKSRKSEYGCPECSVLMKSWLQMSGHLWRNHGIDMELHSCDQCHYKTPSLANLVNFHQRIHGSERPFACDACDKSFKTTKQLRNHKVIHANRVKAAAGEALRCDLCGRPFADSRLLRSHIGAVHKKLKPFNCETCGYAASSRSTLKLHMRLHTGEKPFHCDDCSYTTADHNSLRRHKKRHTGDKPYKCPHCFYACIQSSTFKAHLRNHHPGEKEGLLFSCESCPFHTVSEDIYRAHVAQHKTAAVTPTPAPKSTPPRLQPKIRIHASKDRNSSHAVATAAVSDPLPIILNFSTDAHASEAPSIHDVVEEVSEAIIPGSDLHLLYSNFAGLNQQQSPMTTAEVVYGSQTSDFVMSVLGDSVIQVVDGRNNVTPLVTIGEERITGDLGEVQENAEDSKFKLCEQVRS